METGKEQSIGLPPHLPDVECYSSQQYISFESRESKYKELLDALKDDNNYIIGLQGMAGTGKTMLVKEAGKKLTQSKQFTEVIHTTVSFSPDIKKIQYDIAGPLGLKFDECNESDRPKKLWSRLTNGEKILLILDDVWGDIDFNEIGIPNDDNHKGCRILVITRNLLVCNRLRCSKTIQLDLLSEEDAWIMFKKHAGLSENSAKYLLDKGRKIANECKRLPIVIAVIASSLKGKQLQEEWDVALNSLQQHMSIQGVDDELVTIYKCLKFSYDNMKNEKAKRLFLLCSVFREDEEIPTEWLIRLGIGGGLFGEDYGSYEDARSQVVILKNILVDSCLLLEASQSSVKMHDLVRDAAQWIANKEIRTVQLHDKNQKAMVEREKNIKYLLCYGKLDDMFSCKLDGSKLEILIVIVNNDVKIGVPNSFFQDNTDLRVFHLLYDNYHKLALSLPQSIQSLKNIRSLFFMCIDLGNISILGNLPSLETLDLVHCKMSELPHGITKLEKLKLLNLESCNIIKNNPFEVIKGCSSLEELYFTDSFNRFCREITFPKLQRFCIDENKILLNDSQSKHVSVVRSNAFLSESTLKYCMRAAEVLRLKRIGWGWRNIIPDIVPIDQGMNDLVKLSLNCISQLQCLIDTKPSDHLVPNIFSKLVVLDLYKMENLEELCNGPLSFDSFKSLEKLSINDSQHLKSLFNCKLNLCNLKSVSLVKCPMLISLFQLSTSRSLVLLEELEIYDCMSLENIIIVKDDDDDSGSHGSMFPKLKDVNIEMCSRLEFILSFLSTQDLPALESIRIHSCDKLKYIFLQDVALGSLKQMKLGDLPNLIDIFPNCHRTNLLVSEDQQHDFVFPSEPNSHCPNIWEYAQCFAIQPKILCNFTKIELSHLSKMKSVFILSIAPIMLLETLRISKCDELKNIIIDTGGDDHDSCRNNWANVFPKLKKLHIEDCAQLEYIFGHYVDDQIHTEIQLHLPALEHLDLHDLPSLVSICHKQYHTSFPTLKILQLNNVKYIGDFISRLISESQDSTIMKELSGNMEYFLTLEWLEVYNSKLGHILCLDEIDGQQRNIGLKMIKLINMSDMTCLFAGPRKSFALKTLTRIEIVGCERLEIVFSTSILRCLPQLRSLKIEKCKELKHIIEDDLECEKSSNFIYTNTCFPKLETLVVSNCNKLKCAFPISICKDLTKLKVLVISGSNELEEIFKSESDQKVEFPNLKFVVFINIPKLCHAVGIQFENVKNRFVLNCRKLSLTSASTPDLGVHDLDLASDYELSSYLLFLFKQLQESQGQDTCNEHPSSETTEDFATEIEVQAASGHMLTSSQELMNEQSMDQRCLMNQQHSLEETDTTFKPSQIMKEK